MLSAKTLDGLGVHGKLVLIKQGPLLYTLMNVPFDVIDLIEESDFYLCFQQGNTLQKTLLTMPA
jgi:hypothetical protein